MKEIFVVDLSLKISPVQIEDTEWQKGAFNANLNGQSIIVSCVGWNRFATYAGFESKRGAKEFRKAMKDVRKFRGKKGPKRMKKSDFLFIAAMACFMCGVALFIIFLIFRRDHVLYSTIPFGLFAILVVMGDRKNGAGNRM